MLRRSIVPLVCLSLVGGCVSATQRLHAPPLASAPHVDLSRYLGTWYEIASFPQRYQKGCTATQATYTANADGVIEIHNSCHDQTLDGPMRTAEGRARVVDPAKPSQLEVSFFRPFWGDYWILEVADDYSYAAVGDPTRDSLWILSRTRQLPKPTYDTLLQHLRDQHYEVGRLQITQQPN